eukprot:evm.model.scf_1159.5 EVM.evm.TU.scf_1159.5   scf_1159:36174-39387(+)
MASPAPKHKHNFFLRLDSGAVIGPAHVFGIKDGDPDRCVYLSVHDAHKRGLVGPAEVARLESLVQSARLMAKRQAEGNAGTAPPKKRIKKEHAEAPAPALPDEPSGQPRFYRKCMDILDQVIQDMGKDADIFMKPVSKELVPDYYNIIREPMDLGTIRDKLKKGSYSSPKEFAEDMRLIWKNCKLYNKKGDFVERLGDRASMLFENLWAMSGFANEARQPRTTAGLAAPKYDPGPIAVKSEKPKEVKAEKPKAKSKSSHKKSTGGGHASGKAGGGTANTAPTPVHEQGEPDEDRPMSKEQMQFLVEGLSSLDQDVLESVIYIIKENSNNFQYKEGEEIELDIGELNNKTLWKLEKFLKEHKEKAGEGSPETRVFVNK